MHGGDDEVFQHDLQRHGICCQDAEPLAAKVVVNQQKPDQAAQLDYHDKQAKEAKDEAATVAGIDEEAGTAL
jgi:hypothetical protein